MAREQTAEVMDEGTGEVFSSKEVAKVAAAASGVMVGGVAYKVVEQVNVPTLKHDSNETVCFTILAPIFVSSSPAQPEAFNADGSVKMNDVSVARVRELTNGQVFEYVCNAITADSLKGAYPNDTYVGKSFAIKKLGVVAGKRYKDVQIIEIAPS